MNPLNDRKDAWREINHREARVENYREHERIKKKLIEEDLEMNDRKIKSIEEYNRQLAMNLFRIQKEADKLELQQAVMRQLNVIG
jgi:predicted RNase H-like nuclease (RuvC/YqgF family)